MIQLGFKPKTWTLVRCSYHWCIFEDFGIGRWCMLRSGVADEVQQPKGIFASEGILVYTWTLFAYSCSQWRERWYNSGRLKSPRLRLNFQCVIFQFTQLCYSNLNTSLLLGSKEGNSCWRLYMEAARTPWNAHKSKMFILLAYYILLIGNGTNVSMHTAKQYGVHTSVDYTFFWMREGQKHHFCLLHLYLHVSCF